MGVTAWGLEASWAPKLLQMVKEQLNEPTVPENRRKVAQREQDPWKHPTEDLAHLHGAESEGQVGPHVSVEASYPALMPKRATNATE